MLTAASEFADFSGRIWINTAHQGPLPTQAAMAAYEAIGWKQMPFDLTTERFSGVPQRLREMLGRVVNVPADDIILANSASYGTHLLANGFPWEAGDDVLLVRGDFPSVILPWTGLDSRGVQVRYVHPRGPVLSPEELESHLTPRTKVFCTTWVHSFRGHALDVAGCAEVCRRKDVWFVVNGAQAVGARLIDLGSAGVDAFTAVGFKWLCGPYGTGFVWVKPELRQRLVYNQEYWLARQTADDLQSSAEPRAVENLGARRYDVFGTANFFNFKPWTASLELLLSIGLRRIEEHDQALVSAFIDGLDRTSYELFSPASGNARSTLIVVSHRDPARNPEIYERLRTLGIYCAMRDGRLRFAPHLHNPSEDINRVLETLAECGRS